MIKSIFQLAALAGIMLIPLRGYSQAPVLGASADFALFSTTGEVSNTGLSQLTGNVGSNNGPVTNFGNVDGVMHSGDGSTAIASADLTTAYNQLNAAVPTFFPASLLGNGQVLKAGIYSVLGGATLNNTLTLNGQGNPNAVFIFQVEGAMSSAAASSVLLTNGAKACNVFWKVEGAVSFATNTSFKGTLIANIAAIVLNSGTIIEGRALSTTGAVTISGATVTIPLGCGRAILNGPAPPALASVACYTIFSGNGEVTNTGVSFITGDVGTNVGLTTGYQELNVTGTIHPNPDVSTAQCAADLGTVYTFLNTLPNDIELLFPAAFGNGLVLTSHTYLLDGATVLTGELSLNAQNNANAVFVIKINGALSTSTFASVTLINGAQAKNVFWKVDGAVNLNDFTNFKGTIVANNGAVALNTGVTLSGRALTTNGGVATFAINAQMTPGCNNAVPTSPNLTAVSIGRTTATACSGTSVNPIVRVRNIGNQDVSTYNVRFRVVSSSGNNVTTVTRNRTPFGAGVNDSVALGTSVVLTQIGSYTISAVVIAAGDTVSSNDSTGVRITVNATPTTPTVSGATTFCAGGNTILTSSAATGNVWSNGATTRTITVNAAGNYSVRVVSGTCTSDTSNVVTASVTAVPTTPTVSGATTFCASGNTILTSSAATGNVWSNGATTRTITVNAAGNYSVRVVSGTCTSDTSNVVTASVTALPSTPTVSGAATFCAGGNTILTSSAATGNVWSNGATTRTITVNAAGNYSVKVVSGTCTSDTSNVVTASVTAVPSTPTVSGATSFCAGGNTILTSSAATGNVWSNGATTRTITVNAAGNYSVRVV